MFSIHHTDHKTIGHKMSQRQIRRGVPRLSIDDGSLTLFDKTITEGPSTVSFAPEKESPSNETHDKISSAVAKGRQFKIRKNITTSTIIVSSHQHQTNISSPSNNSGAFPILLPWLTKLK